jgi:hypothetical protein
MTALRIQGFIIATRIHGRVLVREAANASLAEEAVDSQRCAPSHRLVRGVWRSPSLA